jgi:hypothetical protein
MNKIERYVNEVLSNIVADDDMKSRIRDDLTSQLNDSATAEDIDEVLCRMGDPKEVAGEFMDSMYEGNAELIKQVISDRSDKGMYMKRVYEYKSKASILGVPLVHIKLSRYGRPSAAKGIIAIGTVSVGVVSIGAVPLGIICFGGIPAGLIAVGGISVGLLLAIGGVAVGGAAIGGVAVGLLAIGGFTVGNIAIGGYAHGTVAIGDKVSGDYVLHTNHIGPETKAEVSALIRSAFPKLPGWITDMISNIRADLGSRS